MGSIARFYLIILIVLLLGAVTNVNALGYSDDSVKTVSLEKINSPEASVKFGSISIISSPSGAYVYLDGIDTGKALLKCSNKKIDRKIKGTVAP